MQMRKIFVSMLIAAGTLGAVAAPLTSAAQVGVYPNFAPPAVRYEPVPAPRRGFVWVPGHWDWRGHHHVWVSGGWIPARPVFAHQPRGRWHQARDRDGDGVPDRFDRRPDNPYRR